MRISLDGLPRKRGVIGKRTAGGKGNPLSEAKVESNPPASEARSSLGRGALSLKGRSDKRARPWVSKVGSFGRVGRSNILGEPSQVSASLVGKEMASWEGELSLGVLYPAATLS